MTHRPDALAVARDGDLDRAARRLSDPRSDGGLVLVTGPAGIGKSRFAHALLDRLPADLPRVAGTAPFHGGAATPTAWRRVLRSLARTRPAGPAAALLVALGAGPDAAPAHVVDDLCDALAEEYRAAPYVVLLEDVQRFDAADLAVLDALSGPLATGGVAAVACCTVDAATAPDVAAFVRSLAGRHGVEHVALRPLPDDVIERIVTEHAPSPDPAARRRVVLLSRGNPLLAIELARAGDDTTATGPGTLLSRLLAGRARAVDDHGVLDALALLERPATVSLLASAAEVPIAVARRTVEDAVTAGLVELSGSVGIARFAHAVVAAAVRSEVDPDAARRLHYRLATLVAPGGSQDGAVTLERARHLLAAGDQSASTARACLVACMHEERRGSAQTAEELARYGLDVAGADDATRVDLLRALARLQFRAGHTRLAIEDAHRAVALARRCERAVLVRAVGDLAWVDPRVVDVEQGRRALYEEVLAEPACPPHTRALVLARLALTFVLADSVTARRVADEAVELAGSTACPQAVEAARAAGLLTTFRLDTAAEVEEEALRLSRDGEDRAAAGALFAAALCRGDRALVDVMTEQVTREPDRLGIVSSRRMLDGVRLGLAVCDGDAEAVQRHAAEIAEHGTTDLHSLAMPLVMFWYGHTGREVHLPRPFTLTAPSTSDLGRYAALAMATITVLNDRSLGRETVAALVEPRELLLAQPDGPFGDLVPALAALVGNVLEDPRLCRSALDRLEQHADRFLLLTTNVPVAPVGWLVAWAHAGLGDRATALRANETALAVSRRARFELWTAQCLVQRAELLTGADPAAAAAARTALAIAQGKGLDLIARRARDLAQTAPRASSPLSPAQEQVLALAAAGLTNDQIGRRLGLAVSTVEKHLTQVYRRLQMPNRAAAVRWFSARSR